MLCLGSKKIDAPFTRRTSKIEDLACRGCHYCRRAHEKWGEFFDAVDDVVPLNVINKSTKDKETQCGENICVRLVDHSTILVAKLFLGRN